MKLTTFSVYLGNFSHENTSLDFEKNTRKMVFKDKGPGAIRPRREKPGEKILE